MAEHLELCAAVGIGWREAMRMLEPGRYVVVVNLTAPDDELVERGGA